MSDPGALGSNIQNQKPNRIVILVWGKEGDKLELNRRLNNRL